ncbi:protein kinase [Actinophytocola xinjiangensis]|uniref:protein kinase n=1 Tax=Actinophytocola xinjiangensis TaxID=485602 RepID=UPI0009FE1A2E|nr:protein kinase [Actinophytocola xinjiangensis]
MTTADGGWGPGATVLGGFTVVRELGHSGYWDLALVRDEHGDRHAVRRVVVGDLVAQQRFLAEVERWQRLPAHPHLAACRFVRTLDDEVLVFSEYAEGGSLADRIRDGDLYTGGDVTTLLRIAVETAWGLDAAHTMGLPHLDVRPANVVFTAGGTARITGFGAPREPDHLRQLDGDGSIRAAPEGAYAAPEQAEDQPVGRDADVWSWAVTVLEMFAGERTWPSGALADAVLEQLAEHDRWRVPMPRPVVEVLAACLRFDPGARPRSFADIAGTLTDLAADLGLTGWSPPSRPSVLHQPPHLGWGDPRAWLTLAYETAGLDPRTASVFWPGHGGPPNEDLRAFAVARRVLDQAGAPVWTRARLRADTGRAALWAGDLMTGVANLRACADLLAGREDEGSRLLLATVLTELAVAVRGGEDPGPLHQRAIAVAEELKDHPEVLGAALLAAAGGLGEHGLYDQAGAAFERAGDQAGVVAAALAGAKSLHAAGLTGRAGEALAAIHPPDEALAGLVALERAVLAGTPAEALAAANTAVDLLGPLVDGHGRHELAGDLGRAWLITGRAHERLERPRPALAAYRSARTMLAAAVVREGQTGLAGELASAFDREATLVREQDGAGAGAAVAGRAAELWQRLADLGGPRPWTDELATARERFGVALGAAGDSDGARAQFEEVLRLLPESELGSSAARRELAAMAHRQLGVLARRGGEPIRACGHHQHALHLLADAGASGYARVLVLDSLGGALADAGHLDESVQVFQQSAEELDLLVRRGVRGAEDLAASHRRLANALLDLGEFASAADAARTGLGHYERLIALGRTDLAEPAARLRASRGYACHLMSDVDGALAELGAAMAVLGGDPVVAGKLAAKLAALRTVAGLGPGDLPAWFGTQAEALTSASALARAGRTREASRQVEEILGGLGWLIRVLPTEQGYAMCGQAGIHLGMSALHARRNGAAHHGFVVAVDCYSVLVDNGLHQYLEDWARAHVGLASLLTVLGDDEGADDVVTELLANLADIDQSAVPEWRSRAGRAVAEMRVTRS